MTGFRLAKNDKTHTYTFLKLILSAYFLLKNVKICTFFKRMKRLKKGFIIKGNYYDLTQKILKIL